MNPSPLPSHYPHWRALLVLAAALVLLDPPAPCAGASTPESPPAIAPSAPAAPASTPPTHATAEGPHAPERGPTADAIVGFIGALLGAGIGAAASLLVYWLATADQRRRDDAARVLRAHTARTLVQAEIDHNLRTLVDYRRETSTDNPVFSAANQSGREWLASHPPPVWSTVAWHRLLDRLLETVSESELLATYALYAELASYSLAVQKFMNYQVEQKSEDLKSTAHFVQETIATRIEKAGNPLRALPYAPLSV